MALATFTLLLEDLSFHRYVSLRDRLLLAGWALLETFGYRQLTVLWRLKGIVRGLRGRSDWGAMTRTGFTAREPLAAPVVTTGAAV